MTGLLIGSLLLVPFAAVGAWLLRRDRLRLVLMLTILALCAAWLALIGVALTGYRDMDGAVDCWPHCTALQETVRYGFWLLPGFALAGGVVSVASVLVATRSR
jgi:hypothetical protein